MEITSLYQRPRREFGRAVNTFSTTQPESCGSWESDVYIKANYIVRDPAILELQAIPGMSEHEVNTERFDYVTHGMAHIEGGWPKDIDCTEKEQTTRYRKKIEKDEEYIRQVKALGEGVEHSIMQNNAIDIYEVRVNPTSAPTTQAHSPPSRRPPRPRRSPPSCCCRGCAPRQLLTMPTLSMDGRSTLPESTRTTPASHPRPRRSPCSRLGLGLGLGLGLELGLGPSRTPTPTPTPTRARTRRR